MGQIGNLATNTDVPTPVTPLGLDSGVTSLSAGTMHTCAVHNNVAKCWGSNANRQLGINSPSPILSFPDTPVVDP